VRLALLALLLPAAAAAAEPLDAQVKAVVGDATDVQVGVWLGEAGAAAPIYALEPARSLPAASVVKTAVLIELFAANAGRLDEPLGAPLDSVLADDKHPALAPFSPAQRAEIRAAFSGASARTVASIMMGQKKASNAVYNGAANLALALLGGPAEATAKIAARDPAFAGVKVRRYMLASRTANGDNEATPAALAAVLAAVAAGKQPGADAMMAAADAQLGEHRHKEGNLDNDPMTCVKTGFYLPKGKPPLVYVVAAALTAKPSGARAAAHDRLEKLTAAIHAALRAAAAGR
jgi:hypothetical protein